MTIQTNHYQTSDTALATFLIVSGYNLQEIDYSQPRYEYVFRDSHELRELASQYITGHALTEPNTFNRINKKLLRIISRRIQWEDD